MRYNESQVKAIGGSRFFKKRGKRIGLLLLLCVGWMFLVKIMINSPNWIIMVAPLALVLLNVGWSYIQSRNLLWEKYKRNPEILE